MGITPNPIAINSKLLLKNMAIIPKIISIKPNLDNLPLLDLCQNNKSIPK